MLIFIPLLSCRSPAPSAPEVPPAPAIRPAPVDEAPQKAPPLTPLRQPRDVSLFVLAGAETREAAEVALAEASKVYGAMDGMLYPSEGYPRLVARDELKSEAPVPPYLVVGGACTSETFSAQRPNIHDPPAMFAAFFPGSHVLSASWPVLGDEQDCPRVGHGDDPADWETYEPTAVSAGGLTVVGIDRQTADGSEYYDFSWSAYAVLRDDAGRVLAIESWGGEGPGSAGPIVALTSDPPTIELEGSSQDGRCTGFAKEVTESRSKWTVRAKDGEIELDSQELGKSTSTCPEDPWLREP